MGDYKIIDVSAWNANVPYSTLKQQGISGAIIRITEKGNKTDSKFETHWNGCKNNGLWTGVYKYSYATTLAAIKEEANTIVKVLNGRECPLGVWLDLEDSSQRSLPKATFKEMIKAFWKIIENAGYSFGIYTGKEFFNLIDGKSFSCPFWVPSYPYNDTGVIVERLRPNIGEKGWQYSSKYKLNGGNTDISTFDKAFIDGLVNNKTTETTNVQPTQAIVYKIGYTLLKKGAKGETVKTLQTMLNKFGYNLVVDGDFGKNTYNAVTAFQKAHTVNVNGKVEKLDVDGVVGDKTWNALYQAAPSTAAQTPTNSSTASKPSTSVASVSMIIEKATRWMEDLANDNTHGYDQIYRWGEKGDYDCSSAVISAYETAGIPVKSKGGATYTGNMYNAFINNGFIDVTNSVNRMTAGGMQRGDVLLNIVHHVAMYCGNGMEVEASINEKGTAKYGMPGDQSGREILIRQYRNYPWDKVLRLKNISSAVEVKEPSKERKYTGRVTVDKLNVRTGPGTEYGLMSSYPMLNKDNLVDVCDEVTASNGAKWFYIRIAAKYFGYVSSSYVVKA